MCPFSTVTICVFANFEDFDFILCAGDDVSDENMFINLPDKSISIKVGKKTTKANYYVDKPFDIIGLLKKITKSEG